MNKKIKISFVLVLLIGLSWPLITAFRMNGAITQQEAIKLAEKFISDNGYTMLPADKSKLSSELFDTFETDLDNILQLRHNTLQPKAFCIGEDKDGWAIGFLSTKVNLNKLDSKQRLGNLPGRAVNVRKAGKEISMAHKDPLFSSWKKL